MSRDEREPTRLVDADDPAGALLREALPLYAAGVDEARAYARLLETRAARPNRRGPVWVLLAAGVCVAAGSIVWSRLDRGAPTPMADARRQAGMRRSTTRLTDGTEIVLESAEPPQWTTAAPPGTGAVTVALARGSVAVHSRPALAAEDLRIEVGRYRLDVAGDGVRVEADGDRVGVAVERGEVRVWISTKLVHRVMGGERWSSPPAAQVEIDAPALGPPAPAGADEGPAAIGASGRSRHTRTPPPRMGAGTPVVAARAPALSSANCLAQVRGGQTREAETCFARLAEAPGAEAELALYELSRVRHDALGDDAGAARALEEYQRRFPHGALRTEAAVSSFEVLSALGRYDQALAASQVALADSSGDQRARLHLLRGRLLANHLSDCSRAVAEYSAAETGLGPRRAEAAFFRGQCLEKLGRRADATAAYRDAASSSDPTYALRAKERLEELAR